MSFNDADTWRTAHDDGRTKITVSDRAPALITLDQEMQRLDSETRNLYHRLEQNRIRMRVLHEAMRSIHKDGVYTMEGV